MRPKIKDEYRYPYRRISNDSTHVFHFTDANDTLLSNKIELDENSVDMHQSYLSKFLKEYDTKSFLIVRNDSIIFEWYAPGTSDTTLFTTFSEAKAIITTLIGCAIDDGFIKSVDQSVRDFIPELDSSFEKVKIKHLLNHTSGIKFSDDYFSPFAENAQYYYCNDLWTKILELKMAYPPGTKFQYQSANPVLLARILERSTHQTVSHYLQEKIWKPLGMESPARWNLDNADSLGIEKAFCCVDVIARDMAKLGRLYLHKGNWNGKQIVSEKWVDYVTSYTESEGAKLYYSNNIGKSPMLYNAYYFVGMYGQYTYVYPKKNLIIVRFSDKNFYQPFFWRAVMLQLLDQL